MPVIDYTALHWLWSETDRRLDSLTKCVNEGVQIDEASNYCRWLRMSGVLEILERNPQQVPLRVDGPGLRRKVEDVLFECGEWYRVHERSNRPRDAYVSRSKLEAIESELRLICETLGLRSKATSDAVDTAETTLHVLPGAL